MQEHTITINVGKLKGLKISLPNSSKTRPTKAIVRESFFNTIGGEILDNMFIEAFGGSGSMGIEALSRGAKEAVFFEIDSKSASVLKANLTKVNKRIVNVSYQIYESDFLDSITFLQKLNTPTILYLDPPFIIREGMADIYQKCFMFVSMLNNTNIWLIAFECMSGQILPEVLGKYGKIKQKKFGKSTISYYVFL